MPIYDFKDWRGDRDERDWPAELQRGGGPRRFPWIEALPEGYGIRGVV